MKTHRHRKNVLFQVLLWLWLKYVVIIPSADWGRHKDQYETGEAIVASRSQVWGQSEGPGQRGSVEPLESGGDLADCRRWVKESSQHCLQPKCKSIHKILNPFLYVYELASTSDNFWHVAGIFNVSDHFTPEGCFLLKQTLLLISFPHISNLLPLSIFMGKVWSFGAVVISSFTLSGSRRWAASQFALCPGWREAGDV